MAIILAGGFGTRLRAVSRSVPKPLLKVGGKPIVGYILEKLDEVQDIQRVIISTNLSFEQQFREYLKSDSQREFDIVTDRSNCEEEKPGAIASLAEMTSGISDDCLIIAGDNLFTSSLEPMVHAFKHRSCATVALYDIEDRELAKQYSTAIIDSEGMIKVFSEKPVSPETTLIGACIYILPNRTLNRLREYLVDSRDRDNPGRFIEWLCRRESVYGFVLDGNWWDIGTIDQYNEASQVFEARVRKEIGISTQRWSTFPRALYQKS